MSRTYRPPKPQHLRDSTAHVAELKAEIRAQRSRTHQLEHDLTSTRELRNQALADLRKSEDTVMRERAQRLEDLHKTDKVVDELVEVRTKFEKVDQKVAQSKRGERNARFHANTLQKTLGKLPAMRC